MLRRNCFCVALAIIAALPHSFAAPALAWDSPHAGNPILPGYYADPSLLQHEGKVYLYATLDPWGGDTLGCWESSDFKNWTYRVLNWPTKAACTSPDSGGAKVWAPSVVRARDGKFYLFVSVGNEVWVGGADSPLGPWRDLLGGRPLIPKNFRPGFHMIDAEAFIDDDGSAYLYWGSGWGWKNGKCWAAKLAPDMASFEGEVRDVTPANYFEGPFMVKHDGRYFLTYSQGNTTLDTYRVHYAAGATPLGPFTEAANSPILVTDKALDVISPGHHAVFTREGRSYIIYHRQSIPFDPRFIGRQTCVDLLDFTADGLIAKVVPTHAGPPLVRGRAALRGLAATATASSQADAGHSAALVLDDNYATRWTAAPGARGGWLQLDLGSARAITRQELRFEYAWQPCRFRLETSADALAWQPLADHTATPATGSPVVIEAAVTARYLRLVIPESVAGSELSVFEWTVY
jgi:arabinoxylan arabinofuranohydrolase